MKYWQAVNTALAQEMRRDPTVCYLGQDVAAPGGPFGASRGLRDEFGGWRVRDTPISEAGIVGLATGAAMVGLRPIVEVMFADFLLLAADQLVNNAAKLRFMSGGTVGAPLVVRSQCGVGRQSGAQHTQSVEGWFAAVPGLAVVRPATPRDAAGLLKTAIRSDDPVLVIDDLALWGVREDLPDDVSPIPFGMAAVRRPGTDVTLVSWASGVGRALAAASALASDHGVEAEVVDLRTLSPLDAGTLRASVDRTGALVVVENGPELYGPGAQVVAAAQARSAARVTAKATPTPYARPLLDAYYPTTESIVDTVRKLLADG